MKKLNLLRPEIEVETSRPVLGRLCLLAYLPKLIKVYRQNVCVNIAKTFGYVDCGTLTIKKVWYICIPKIKVVDCVE